jgi:hypothetical protein
MKYLVLCYAEDGVWPPEEHMPAVQESLNVCLELHSRRQFIDAAPLEPRTIAAYVRVRDGEPIISDGPFLETKEHVGGYFLIDVPSIDDAIAFAARLPGAHRGTAEIRQVMEVSGLPNRH